MQPGHDAIVTPWHDHLEGRGKAQFPTAIQLVASGPSLPNLTITLLVLSALGCNMDTCPQRSGLQRALLCVFYHVLNLSFVISIEKSSGLLFNTPVAQKLHKVCSNWIFHGLSFSAGKRWVQIPRQANQKLLPGTRSWRGFVNPPTYPQFNIRAWFCAPEGTFSPFFIPSQQNLSHSAVLGQWDLHSFTTGQTPSATWKVQKRLWQLSPLHYVWGLQVKPL